MVLLATEPPFQVNAPLREQIAVSVSVFVKSVISRRSKQQMFHA
jgi:hypothetical protein